MSSLFSAVTTDGDSHAWHRRRITSTGIPRSEREAVLPFCCLRDSRSFALALGTVCLAICRGRGAARARLLGDSRATSAQRELLEDESLVKNQPDEFKASSFLRVSELLAPDLEGYCYGHRWWLSRGGELRDWRTFRTGSGSGGAGTQHDLTAAELAHVQQLISNLPPPNMPSTKVDLLLVASLSNGSWVTRVYDKAKLPPAVQDLVRVLEQPEAITRRSRLFSTPDR